MKIKTALLVTSVWLTACGGGGGGNSTDNTIPSVTTPPVVVTPPVVTPPIVKPPTVAACAAPTTAQTPVLYNGTPMLSLCDGVYVEPTATADEQLSLRQSISLAYQTVTDFYTTFTAPHPRMILCQTASCRSYFMGTYAGVYAPVGYQLSGAQYTSGVPTIFLTYTSFPNLGRQSLAHELTHTETLFRYGDGGVPDWFNEGTATMVGGSPDCTGQTANLITDLSTSDVNDEFTVMAADSSKGTAVYCQAAREVEAWVAINGKQKFYDLLVGVKAGQQFSALYGPLINH